MPNAPPTSSVTTRSRSGGETHDPRQRVAQRDRALGADPQGVAVGRRRRSCAVAPRGSMVEMTRRWFTQETRATCAAPAIAASTARALASFSDVRACQSSARLLVASGHSCGAPGAAAAANVDDRRHLLVVDRHALGRILGGGARGRHHQRDRLADMQHAILGERRPERHDQLGAVAPGHRRMGRDVADARRLHVVRGEDGEHAGGGTRLAGVDRPDARVRMGRAHEPPERFLGDMIVGDEAAVAAQERVVLDAPMAGVGTTRAVVHAGVRQCRELADAAATLIFPGRGRSVRGSRR